MRRLSLRIEQNRKPETLENLAEMRDNLRGSIEVMQSRCDRIKREVNAKTKEIHEYRAMLRSVEAKISAFKPKHQVSTDTSTQENVQPAGDWATLVSLKENNKLSWSELGEHYGVSGPRARQLYEKGKRFLSSDILRKKLS